MELSAKNFCRIGIALFGNAWIGSTAHALGVPVRTIERWASDERGIPPGIWRELATICKGRGAALLEIAETLAK